MKLQVISPTEIIFEGEATLVSLPGLLGTFAVLPRHAALISTLVKGVIRYNDTENTEHTIPIEGGIADVHNDVISVCVN